jgi:queuine tRNA-ribosyltransferase
LKEETNSEQLLFGIAQGGTREEYRRFSTFKINNMDFDGFALGGLVIGESRKDLMNSIKLSVSTFDKNKVRYLMGLGSPPDIIKAIGEGVDAFDSIYPTSNARHGSLFTRTGRIDIKKIKYKHDFGPIDDDCGCEVCKNYSKAYIHHLLRTHELLGYKLATIHNLYFMQNLLSEARTAIKEGRFKEFSQKFLEDYFSKNEAKEFSNHIALKYKQELKKPTKPLFLDWKK